MQEQIQQRLTQLKAEFEAGQKMLADLEAQQARLRETMLRISGAVQGRERRTECHPI
jgi:predicted nuclease with TOPRIM domain